MKKGEKKREEILTAAGDLFAQKGYLNTSIQDILDALDTSKGSFYHHFPAKFDLLAALAKERALSARVTFEQERPADALQALDVLLYHVGLFHPDNLPLLSHQAALSAQFEGATLMRVMQQTVDTAFFPVFLSLALRLQQAGQADFHGEISLRLTFWCFLSGCELLLSSLDKPSEALGLLRSLRRMMDSALGLKAGSLVIVDWEALQQLAPKP